MNRAWIAVCGQVLDTVMPCPDEASLKFYGAHAEYQGRRLFHVPGCVWAWVQEAPEGRVLREAPPTDLNRTRWLREEAARRARVSFAYELATTLAGRLPQELIQRIQVEACWATQAAPERCLFSRWLAVGSVAYLKGRPDSKTLQ
jgi:hypothetical protein